MIYVISIYWKIILIKRDFKGLPDFPLNNAYWYYNANRRIFYLYLWDQYLLGPMSVSTHLNVDFEKPSFITFRKRLNKQLDVSNWEKYIYISFVIIIIFWVGSMQIYKNAMTLDLSKFTKGNWDEENVRLCKSLPFTLWIHGYHSIGRTPYSLTYLSSCGGYSRQTCTGAASICFPSVLACYKSLSGRWLWCPFFSYSLQVWCTSSLAPGCSVRQTRLS